RTQVIPPQLEYWRPSTSRPRAPAPSHAPQPFDTTPAPWPDPAERLIPPDRPIRVLLPLGQHPALPPCETISLLPQVMRIRSLEVGQAQVDLSLSVILGGSSQIPLHSLMIVGTNASPGRIHVTQVG